MRIVSNAVFPLYLIPRFHSKSAIANPTFLLRKTLSKERHDRARKIKVTRNKEKILITFLILCVRDIVHA